MTKTPPNPVKIYQGSSSVNGIERRQSKEILTCKDPKFDKFSCMLSNDLKNLVGRVLTCEIE